MHVSKFYTGQALKNTFKLKMVLILFLLLEYTKLLKTIDLHILKENSCVPFKMVNHLFHREHFCFLGWFLGRRD